MIKIGLIVFFTIFITMLILKRFFIFLSDVDYIEEELNKKNKH